MKTDCASPAVEPQKPLAAGTVAPEFRLPRTTAQTVSLGALRGRPVVLVFYPADWELLSREQLGFYQEMLPEFQCLDAVLLGISVDSVWCHQAFAQTLDLQFPLLADCEPKGAVARAYGVLRPQSGTSERALFVVDAEGVIRWSHRSPIGVDPGAGGILAALEALHAERTGRP
jgi:peroxiredoxin